MPDSPPSDNAHPETLAAPPPGCPAHDLIQLGRLEAADSRQIHEELRREYGSVAPVLLPGDLPAWLVLGHEETLKVARNPLAFTRDSRQWRHAEHLTPDHPLFPIIGWQPLCAFTDGSEHKRLRQALNDSLDNLSKHGIRAHIRRYADRLIDSFIENGEADLVGQFANHLPLLVIAKLFGMPAEADPQPVSGGQQVSGPQLVEAAWGAISGGETAAAANEFLTETLQGLVERKRTALVHDGPPMIPDIPSNLLAHPSGLSDLEIREHLRLILIASNATTVSLIGNLLLKVLTDDGFRGSLNGGQMTLPSALDQVLWDSPPMERCPHRVATGDTVVGETRIPEGELLVLGLAAANFDPAIRPDPSVPVHGNGAHLAFSAGPHACPGQDFARAITETGIGRLLDRLPGLSLAVPPEDLRRRSDWTSSLLESLPVTFPPSHPRPAPAEVPAGGTAAMAVIPPLPPMPPPHPVVARTTRKGVLQRVRSLFRRRR